MLMKKLIISTFFILGFAIRPVLAECTLNPDYNYPLTVTIPMSDRVWPEVNQSVTVRGEFSASDIASLMGTTLGTVLATCTNGETLILENTELTVAPIDNGTWFSSGLDGFVLQFTLSSRIFPFSGNVTATVGTSGSYSLSTAFPDSSNYGYAAKGTAITDVAGGTVEGGLVVRLRTSDDKEIARIYFSSFHVIIGTCWVNTWDSEVDFGELALKELRETGSTSDEQGFSINASCGITERTPSITFEGATDSVYTTVFTNQDDEGYAGGVGIQLLRDNTVITPGEEVNLGQITAASTPTDYLFSSRVFSLSGQTTEGIIDIPVVFTLTYE